jgi:hypothetical protein
MRNFKRKLHNLAIYDKINFIKLKVRLSSFFTFWLKFPLVIMAENCCTYNYQCDQKEEAILYGERLKS